VPWAVLRDTTLVERLDGRKAVLWADPRVDLKVAQKADSMVEALGAQKEGKTVVR